MSDIDMASIDGDDDIDITDIKGLLSGSEEGEINDSSDDDASGNQHKTKEYPSSESKITQHSFISEGNDAINRSIFDDIDLAKMEERANKFGFDKTSDTKTLQREMKDLHESLAIETEDDIRHARFDTIHVHGTEKMNTNDVFEYFFAHKPLFLEWIDNNSCNVVWKDDISAARAMVFYSKEMINDKIDEDAIINGLDKASDVIYTSSVKVSIPPGKWRAGAPHPKSNYIFMRFANRSDKKVSGMDKLKVLSEKYRDENSDVGLLSKSMKTKIKTIENDPYDIKDDKSKNPWGELCQTWGINDSQESFGVPALIVSESYPMQLPAHNKRTNIKQRIGNPSIPKIPITERLSIPAKRKENISLKMRLGKRLPVVNIVESSESEDVEDEETDSSDEEWTSKSKVPRMRMHADDEQEKINKIKNKGGAEPIYEYDEINNITVEIKNEIVNQEEKRKETRDKHRNIPHKKKTNDLRSRLGKRRNSHESDSEDSTGFSRRSSAVSKVSSRHKSSTESTVWSRLDINNSTIKNESNSDSEVETYSDLRHALSKTSSTAPALSRPGFDKGSIRSRLGKKPNFHGSPLRIEVDNELCLQSDED